MSLNYNICNKCFKSFPEELRLQVWNKHYTSNFEALCKKCALIIPACRNIYLVSEEQFKSLPVAPQKSE